MSCTGMLPVMQTIVPMPAVGGLVDAAAGEPAGTKDEVASAPVASTASWTAFEHRNALDLCPPLPGVTPADDVRAVGTVAQPVEATLATVSP